ncbi:hypothetical protein ACEE21_12120 [Clostridium baratii]
MSNQAFQNIYNYLLTERLNEISNLNINYVKIFIKNNEQIILDKFPLENQDWKNFKKELSQFLKASITINYCYKENPNLYSKLLSCKNKDEVQKVLAGNLPIDFSTSHNIRKQIIKIIKFIKNNPTNGLTVVKNHKKADSTQIYKPRLTLDMLIEILNKNNINKDLNDLSDEEINSKLLSLLENQYVIPSNVIDEYILKHITRPNPTATSNTEIDKFTIINKDYDEKIIQLTLERDSAIKSTEETQGKYKLLLYNYSTLENDLKNAKAELEHLKSKEKNMLKNLLFINPLDTASAFSPNDRILDVKVKVSLVDKAFNFFYKKNVFDAQKMRNYNMSYNDLAVNLSLLIISNLDFE